MTDLTAPFTPTHRVAASGAPAWHAPRPDAAPAPGLDPGLPVAVLDRSGDWAHVRCANGWETWTDARALEPLAMPAGPPAAPAGPPSGSPAWPAAPAVRRSRPVVVVGLVAGAVAVVLLLLVVANRSDDGEQSTTGGTTASTAPATTTAVAAVGLNAPAGWVVSSDGRTAATSDADLRAAVALGPRAIVTANATVADPAGDFAKQLGTPYTVVAGPEQTTIAGRPAVAVTLRWTVTRTTADYQPKPVDYLGRFVVVTDAAGDGVLFELTAPADQWDALASTWAAMPRLG